MLVELVGEARLHRLRHGAVQGRAALAWSEQPVAGGPAPLRVVVGDEVAPVWSGQPITLTETLLAGSAALVADERDLYAAWIDMRFDPENTWAGRIMITASRDRGVSFAAPSLVSDPDEPE